jgi:enoyl-CoA hydratase/carnithine racemase
MAFTDILYGVEERVATIRFNRPTSLNALTLGMLGEVSDALDRATEDESVQLDLECELQRECGRSNDFTEGATAFAQNRKPNFMNR